LSGTVTFLFSDIEGSTGLLKRLGREPYGELLWRHQVLVREVLAAHRGEELDTQGDAFFVAFRSASDAIAAAAAIQRALAQEAWPEGGAVRVRIGIHAGEASAARDRYVGVSVHRAARVGAVAHGGQVLLSDAARVLVEDDLPAGLSLRNLGLHRLKDIDRPERIWQLVGVGLSDRFARLRTERRRRRFDLRLAAAVVLLAGVALAAVVLLTRGRSGAARAAAPVAADSIGVFSVGGGRELGQTSVGTSPGGIAAGAGAVWVANTDDGSLSRLDPRTGSVVDTIRVGPGPSSVAVGGGSVWVANSLDGTVSRVAPRTNTVVQRTCVGG
jgi:YVTN family beta-propeller protein